jgi:hypothetical protein
MDFQSSPMMERATVSERLQVNHFMIETGGRYQEEGKRAGKKTKRKDYGRKEQTFYQLTHIEQEM